MFSVYPGGLKIIRYSTIALCQTVEESVSETGKSNNFSVMVSVAISIVVGIAISVMMAISVAVGIVVVPGKSEKKVNV